MSQPCEQHEHQEEAPWLRCLQQHDLFDRPGQVTELSSAEIYCTHLDIDIIVYLPYLCEKRWCHLSYLLLAIQCIFVNLE